MLYFEISSPRDVYETDFVSDTLTLHFEPVEFCDSFCTVASTSMSYKVECLTLFGVNCFGDLYEFRV